MRTRSYSELEKLDTFDERFEYLNLNGIVGESTFGFDRWINQHFYTSREWRQTRQAVILRDGGCDLGVPGLDIEIELLVHHMNPLTRDDILFGGERPILDPEYLITTTKNTHNAIHYGNRSLLPKPVLSRQPGDTKLW